MRRQPIRIWLLHSHARRDRREPAVQLLVNLSLLHALVALLNRLDLEWRAVDLVGKEVAVAVGVQGLLERVTLPAKDIISVHRVAGPITRRPEEGLLAVSWPLRLVVERRGVPVSLVEDLRYRDGVGAWARAALGIGSVALVVGTVQVLAIPTCREAHGNHDASLASTLGEAGRRARSRHGAVQAGIGHTGVLPQLLLCAEARVSNCHAEAGLKGGRLTVGQIVNGLAAVGSGETETVANGVDTVVGAILSLEEKHSRPVVGEVIDRRAAGARGYSRHVMRCVVHSDVKGVPSNDLVKVRGGSQSRVH